MKHNIKWNNIEIEIEYDPDYSAGFREVQGEDIAHLQIRANQPLPITETGYKSHFLSASIVEDRGGVVKYVMDGLNEAAKKPKWKKHVTETIQLSLF